ncbi:MAG: NTP transferase domain-containing protein [Elusimicrobia bacterium]|nr:NTP transferase domain-containing protein [Elusimicrobiota bacterium]MDE2510475.1 NTP transferase domain-containing protein [Elusimicrobiota bacterium]
MTFAAGVIAAGEGSRLAHSHPGLVKPLVSVAGRPLSHWVVGSLRDAGARELTVLTNSRGGAVPPSLKAAFPALPFDFLAADTASSFESFRLVARRLAERHEAFLISTVDVIAPAADVARFWAECRASRADAGLALTAHVDDEKPLWADVDETGLVTAVGDDARTRRRVTCGLYFLSRASVERLPEASAHARLRDYWRSLIASGARVSGPTLSKTLDVDRPEDVAAAEAHLTTETKR